MNNTNIIRELKYDYDDLSIVPAEKSSIESESDVDVHIKNSAVREEDGMLPIFTSPKDFVVDEYNYKIFRNNGIIPIINKNVRIEKRLELTKQGEWCAYSLGEFDSIFNNDNDVSIYEGLSEVKALIEPAFGNMRHILNSAIRAKTLVCKRFDGKCRLVLMAGSVVNPKTSLNYGWAEIDYIRCSGGFKNESPDNTSIPVHYPAASLIMEVRNIKKKSPEVSSKIVADGGFKNISEAIVALACGADYVMIDNMLGSLFESSAVFDNMYKFVNTSNGYFDGMKDNREFVFVVKIKDNNICKEYDNLAIRYSLPDYKFVNTIDARIMYISLTLEQMQIDEIGRWIIKHTTLWKIMKDSEQEVTSEVKQTLKQWTERFKDMLSSVMFCCNKRQLADFVGHVVLVPNNYVRNSIFVYKDVNA